MKHADQNLKSTIIFESYMNEIRLKEFKFEA